MNQYSEPNNTDTKENPVGRFMVAVGSVIQREGTQEILLLHRNPQLDWRPDEWEIPYGRIAQFEHPEDGIRREVREETGISDIRIEGVLTVWHMYRGSQAPQNDLVGITYRCITKQTSVRLSSEHVEYKWATPAEALSLIKVDAIRRDISAYIVFLEGNV